jgi:alpha-1,3-rhamnosyl/mannosyltransferase
MNNKHLKIAFDASPLLVNKTGVAYYIERLISQLAKQYPDVEFVGFYYNFLGRKSTSHFPAAPNIRYRAVRFIPSKVVYQLRRWGLSLPLEVLTKERSDFVLFGNFWGYPSIFKTAAAPVVHDLTYLDLPDYVAVKNRKDLTKLIPAQIKRSRFVVTVSEFTKLKIADVYDVAPQDIIVTPIPPAPLTPHAPEVLKAELDTLGIKQPYILFVGTIEPRKNIPQLITAYRLLPESIRNTYSLVIVGRIGWNCAAEVAAIAKAKADKLRVIHLGYVSDDARDALYANAALFAHASHYEGFGMPVLEAMRYGLASALSDIAVFHEVAADDALYFKHNNPQNIADVLQTLIQDDALRARLGLAAKQRAETAFSWEVVARDLMDRIASEVARQR